MLRITILKYLLQHKQLLELHKKRLQSISGERSLQLTQTENCVHIVKQCILHSDNLSHMLYMKLLVNIFFFNIIIYIIALTDAASTCQTYVKCRNLYFVLCKFLLFKLCINIIFHIA